VSTLTRKNLMLHKGRAGGDREWYAMLPFEVLQSEAYRTLTHQARSVLTALAAQFHGYGNGSQTLTRDDAQRFGIGNPYMLDRSLRELEARALIVKTRPGSRQPPQASMYAVGWLKIDHQDRLDPHDATPTLRAPDEWRKWKPEMRGRNRQGACFAPYWSVPTARKAGLERIIAGEGSKHERHEGRRRAPMQRGDTRERSAGMQGEGPPSSTGIPNSSEDSVARGYASNTLGCGSGEVGDEVGGISRVGPASAPPASSEAKDEPPIPDTVTLCDLENQRRRAKLYDLARAKMREHGHQERETNWFFGSMKRHYTEGALLAAIIDYLTIRPRNPLSKELIDFRDWVGWRCREVCGKPLPPGVPRLVP